METTLKILGLIGIGGIITFIVKWYIEKRRIRFKRRVELIDNAKNEINIDNFNRIDFIKTPIYSNLKRHLSEKFKKQIESSPLHFYIEKKDGNHYQMKNFKKELLDEIAVLEEKWKLI